MMLLTVDETVMLHGELLLATGGRSGQKGYDDILTWITRYKI